MDYAGQLPFQDTVSAGPQWPRREETRALPETAPSFDASFADLFDAHFHRLYRYLDRLTGEPELAADLAQEAFVKLYRRGALPDAPVAWLISVAMNLLRNEQTTRARRRRLLTLSRGAFSHSDPPPSPAQEVDAADTRHRVRSAIDQLPERERRLLLLQAEGYGYRDIAAVLELNEASVGTLLARARAAFKAVYGDPQ